MLSIKNMSFKGKLLLYAVSATGTALTLCCIAVMTAEWIEERRNLPRNLGIQADVIGVNTSAALTFDDRASAEESLRGLKADENIIRACICSRDGTEFARYTRPGSEDVAMGPVGAGDHRFSGDRLHLRRPIVLDGEQIGSVYLQYDLREFYGDLKAAAAIMVGGMLVALVGAALVSSKIQRVLTRPVTELANTARAVAENNDYSVRAVKHSADELGALTDCFNEMLARIQQRESALDKAHSRLEERVKQRTAELTATNVRLENEITVRKRAEEDLRLQSAALESAANGVLIADRDGRICWVNPAFTRLTGYAGDDVLGRNPRILKSGMQDQAFYRNLWNKVLSGDVWRGEIINRRKDGSLYTEDMTITPVANESGELTYFVAIKQDITERREMRERIQESEARHRAISESARDAIITASSAGAILFWNPAAETIFGYTTDEAVGRSLFDLIVPRKYHEAKRKGMGLFAKTGEGDVIGKSLELTALRKDGSEFPIEISVSRYRYGDGFAGLALVRDITNRKRAEEEFEELHQELVRVSRQAGMSEVATGVLHNVGNVLTSVNVSATLIAEKMRKSRVANLGRAIELMSEHAHDLAVYISQDEQGKQLPGYLSMLAEHLAAEQASIMGELEVITDNVEHIKTIVSTQQSYTGVSGVSQSTVLSDVLNDVLKLGASSLARHDIEVVRDYNEVPPVVTDKHKLLQIMMNLLKNANHALIAQNGQPKRLTVRLRLRDEGRVRIDVIDTGVGIQPENLARVFEYGFTTKERGHGFGLHSSALAATEIGGSLTAHSDGAGKGATFTLELPLQPTRIDTARAAEIL